jgi:hypothetical protein
VSEIDEIREQTREIEVRSRWLYYMTIFLLMYPISYSLPFIFGIWLPKLCVWFVSSEVGPYLLPIPFALLGYVILLARDKLKRSKMHNAHSLVLEEGQRQMLLLALAHLAVERPGWDEALSEIAQRIDNRKDGKPEMYEHFRVMHQEITCEKLPTSEPSTPKPTEQSIS